MHTEKLRDWQHGHSFHLHNSHGERNTKRVIILTLVMMVIEIAAGAAFGSMALLADGWHMGTHAVALIITAVAYWYARKHAQNPAYSFGTGKVGVLGGYSSAIILGLVALLMAAESITRIINPVQIKFNEAITVAVIGLLVNIVSALLLHDHQGRHQHGEHSDHNLRAAYLHVLADALTSLLAITALFAGKGLGWIWLDPVMGIAGALLIIRWAWGLLRETGGILLDGGIGKNKVGKIVTAIEADSDTWVSDIHVWRLSSHHYSAIISIVTLSPKPPEHYKKLLVAFNDLSHITVEVNQFAGPSRLAPH